MDHGEDDREKLLDNLLSIGTALLEEPESSKNGSKLKEINLLEKPDDKELTLQIAEEKSLVHGGDTDSSDDELYERNEYNDFGKAVKSLLKPTNTAQRELTISWTSNTKASTRQLTAPAPQPPKGNENFNVFTIPMFGIRVIKPLISSQLFLERMEGKDAVSLNTVQRYTQNLVLGKDWVIAGTIINKSVPKVSQKGSDYAIWMLSDLHIELKTVSIFVFRNAYKELWKTAPGTVIGILNPKVFENKSTKDEASLCIDNSHQVMIFGQSRDMGTCKSIRKDGQKCTAFVNTSHCEYCIYHVKQEYQKCSRRSELQSNFSGRGLTALRNKVLGKDEVFYAGKSYTAIPAKKSSKLIGRDEERLRLLAGKGTNLNKIGSVSNATVRKPAAAMLEISHKQRVRNMELFQKLNRELSNQPLTQLKTGQEVLAEKSINNNATSLNNNATAVNTQTSSSAKNILVPTLKSFSSIDLSVPITRKRKELAKFNAIKYVQQNGPIEKANPMNTRGTAKKRSIGELDGGLENEPKIQKNEFFSDRFKKMMAMTSKHTDLLEQRDQKQEEKYFNKLEIKERMEEKMLGTYKIGCKAVRCLKCKYTNFSAAEICKTEKHPLKVFEATKRFFKCGDCSNRTTVLTIVPTISCKNCGSGKWEKTSMMKEKKIDALHSLSIRGGEQTFLNSGVSNGNLDLLLPDDQ